MDFYSWLAEVARRNDSLLCVGLDPRPDRLAPGDDLFSFNRRIVDATQDQVCAYKPNFAFYESAGPEGLEALRRTVAYIHETAKVPVILDAKRGDIGSTAEAYARAAFEVWGADALTVNPYLGHDSVTPFTAYAEKGVFLLCHTSNPGATDLQTLPSPSRPLYEIVAEKAAAWSTGLVVGATYPEALARVRSLGVIANSSRAIIYASDPHQAALEMRRQINAARTDLPSTSLDFRSALTLALADIGAIQFGEFTLASGQGSPIYIDLRLLASHPGILRQVAHAFADLLRRELDVGHAPATIRLAAIPYAALPIGTAVALDLGLPLIYPRKETKTYGTARQIEGQFVPGEEAIVLDDLITTGDSKLQAIEPLEAAGLKVRDVVVLIDREQGGREELEAAGYRLHAILRLSEMLNVLAAAGRIDAKQRDRIAAFLRGS
jgi:uridine monophosphate synthetase